MKNTPPRVGDSMPWALEQRLAEVEAKIRGVQQQIGEQRKVVVKLESAGCAAEHAKYLLAGLELLQAAYRESRAAMLSSNSNDDLVAEIKRAKPPMSEEAIRREAGAVGRGLGQT